ncbi:hypothetical protein MNBD_GAMMA11-1462, partial [hydrothermal vent metagenome]
KPQKRLEWLTSLLDIDTRYSSRDTDVKSTGMALRRLFRIAGILSIRFSSK